MARRKSRPLPQDLGLGPGGGDSHAHLNMGTLAGSLDEVLARAKSCGVSTIGNVFLGPGAYEEGKELFENFEQVFFILGIHPHEARAFGSESVQEITAAVKKDNKIKAVGEIGLDFFYDFSPVAAQRKAFMAQLESAKSLDMPVVIHSRDAYQQTIEILLDMGFRDRPVLWHCFGQGSEQAREIMSLGWHISVPGSVTYKKSQKLREAVKIIDLNRLLIETDCPFLAPEPYRGKENEPALLGFTAVKIAEIKGMAADELWHKCGDNCREFFSAA